MRARGHQSEVGLNLLSVITEIEKLITLWERQIFEFE